MSLVFKSIRQLERGQSKRTIADTILFMVLCSVSVLFLPLIAMLLNSYTIKSTIRINSTFSLSTLLLVFSSAALRQVKQAILNDHYKKLKLYLSLSLFLGVGFLGLQALAWGNLYQTLNPKYENIVVVIVLLHALHFIVAIVILIRFFLKTLIINSPTDSYIFFLNPKRNQLFKMTRVYWDFLGILWLALYIIMLLKTI
jgi:cytochrome c oxidase subunit 3